MIPVVLGIVGQFLDKHISSAYSDCTEGSGSATVVNFENFLFSYILFSQFFLIISTFFLKLLIFQVIPSVLPYFPCCKPEVVVLPSTNAFKFTGMVY